MTKTISWGDGTSDVITFTYVDNKGDQTIQISTNNYNQYTDREKTVSFQALVNGEVVITKTLLIRQLGKDLIVVTDNNVATSDNNVVGGDE